MCTQPDTSSICILCGEAENWSPDLSMLQLGSTPGPLHTPKASRECLLARPNAVPHSTPPVWTWYSCHIAANFNCAFCNFPEFFFQTFFLFVAWLNPKLIDSTDAESLGPMGQLCSPGNKVSFPTQPIDCSETWRPSCSTLLDKECSSHQTAWDMKENCLVKADFSKTEVKLILHLLSCHHHPPSNQPTQLGTFSHHLLFYMVYFILFPYLWSISSPKSFKMAFKR